jgi:hypothetical protein
MNPRSASKYGNLTRWMSLVKQGRKQEAIDAIYARSDIDFSKNDATEMVEYCGNEFCGWIEGNPVPSFTRGEILDAMIDQTPIEISGVKAAINGLVFDNAKKLWRVRFVGAAEGFSGPFRMA